MKVQLPKRRLIPRWRKVASTLALAEGQPQGKAKTTSAPEADSDDLKRAIDEWKAQPTAGHLGDVLAFSIVRGCSDEVLAVARDATKRGQIATQAQEALIRELLAGNEATDTPASTFEYSICNPFVQKQMRDARQLLRANPANPLVLLDLAQLQLSAGSVRRAERSLLSALTLSPNNRLVIRTLARFYVHTGRADVAHAILSRHSRTPHDPWLMAGEIATSQAAKVGSKFAKVGSKVALEKRRVHSHFTELAGAVAGLELNSGNWRRARELFRLALLSPNDNVMAQAITDQHELLLDLNAPAQQRVALGAAEARTLLSWQSLDVDGAEVDAMRWHSEEPFSSRPLQFLTALGAVQGSYDRLITLAKRGLVADRRDAVLTANLAYGLASIGRLDDAERVVARARALDKARIGSQTTATLGLIAMKRSNFEQSDLLYSEAIAEFEAAKRPDMAAICYAYFARAAIEIGHPRAAEILETSVHKYSDAPSIDAALILKQLHSDIEQPKSEEPTRRLAQWIYDAKTNSLVLKEGVSRPGAPPILFSPRRAQ